MVCSADLNALRLVYSPLMRRSRKERSLFQQPSCRIKNLVENDITKRQTAYKYLKQLTSIGVLWEVRAGKEKLFIHPKWVELMTGDENEIENHG